MPCFDVDPADFESGIIDPGDDPTPDPTELSINDVSAAKEPDGTMFCKFEITCNPINYNAAVQVTVNTANGTAIAGTHYIARTGLVVTIPAGEGAAEVAVTILTPSGISGEKNFFVNLSLPVNAVLGDSQGKGSIYYQGSTPPPPPDTDPLDLVSYTGWPDSAKVVYNQFADCRYKAACTGYCGAAVSSALEWRETGDSIKFDPKLLFSEAGGTVCTSCSNCPGYYTTRVLNHMRDTGAKFADSSTRRRILSKTQLTGTTKQEILDKVKKAVYANGAVTMESIWYSAWNNVGSGSGFILKDMGNATGTIAHCWCIVGWNNNKATGGAFYVQHSGGTGWGQGGRAWLPYSYIKPFGNFPNPYYRFWAVVDRAN